MGNAFECCCKKVADKPICEFDNNEITISCCIKKESHKKANNKKGKAQEEQPKERIIMISEV